MYKKNKTCREPKNENARIWKYLDFTKFISLLETNSLFFSRSDKMKDPYEGFVAMKNKQRVNSKTKILLNCWHKNKYESAAMWSIYLKSHEGIAIQSTFKRLKNCFNNTPKPDIFISKITYIDYKKRNMTKNGPLWPFVYKRKSFEYEKEIRALVYQPKKETDTAKQSTTGIFVPVDVALLIENIYVAPSAEAWIYDLVKSVVKKYNFEFPVIKSNLFDKLPT